MRRAPAILVSIGFILSIQTAYAAKLAPQTNTLQPIPPNVQPALSQSVQRSATQADVQTIQNVQNNEQSSNPEPQASQDQLPTTPYAPSAASNSIALWVAIAMVILAVGGAVWLWRSF